ncbi:methyltransferase [Bacillus alkalicellulosilyticus]|uniref:methyltransferase n=1 Tax=Alkalihalobacterium alkalicellulosilyticum TaxID=1912214 RepID=UPI0009981366|nr:methyltransferase [Bacillus alkalicellulosilyticus]
MNKILVEVYVPVLNNHFDVYLPLTSKVYEIKILLVRALEDMTAGYFISHENVICDRHTGEVLDINKSVLDLELINGSKLMLI